MLSGPSLKLMVRTEGGGENSTRPQDPGTKNRNSGHPALDVEWSESEVDGSDRGAVRTPRDPKTRVPKIGTRGTRHWDNEIIPRALNI
jgi:hypothetical protein